MGLLTTFEQRSRIQRISAWKSH